MTDDSADVIPLVTLWNFLEGETFGMAQFYRGLQGNGRVLRFQQSIYHAAVGRNLPALVSPLLLLMAKQRNKKLLNKLVGNPWILGGQQFVHLFSRASLQDAIVVVFDLLPIDYPDAAPLSVSVDQHKNKFKNIHFARGVVTISEYSKQRIVAHYGIDPAKISVIHFGIDAKKFQKAGQEERQAWRLKLQIPDSAFVILYVGSEQRRKNLPTLVKALSELRKSIPEIVFLKVGRPQSTEGRNKFQADLVRTRLSECTKIIEYVPDEELPKLYGLADLFAFPSVGEGFGVPLLEAMACGIPIVTTGCCSIPEVVGDTALKVTDPYNSMEWCAAMRSLIESPETRQEMSVRGSWRANQMQWETPRLKFLHVIKSAVLL